MTEPATLDTICHHPDRASKLTLDALLPYVPASAGRVLDCTGDLASRGTTLKKHGVAQVSGLVDTSAGALDGDEGYDQLATGPLDFVKFDYPSNAFDIILITHAIERLRNPEAFLERLLPALAEDGMLVLTVPNMQYHKTVFMLAEGRWCYGDSGVMARKNLRFYTAQEMRWLFQRLGFTNVRITSLVKDDEAALPRDAEGFVQRGDVRAGPLTAEQHTAWLTEYYLILAARR